MVNFKEETEYAISQLEKEIGYKLEIKEVALWLCPGCGEGYYDQEEAGEIDWDLAASKNFLDLGKDNPWEYDDGYGLQTFGGFITFSNCGDWLERKEYDGSEWWAVVRKPSLAKRRKEREEDERKRREWFEKNPDLLRDYEEDEGE